MQERRKYIRLNKALSITYQVLRRILRHPACCVNISEGGIRLLVSQRLEPGTIIKLWFNIEEIARPIFCTGLVIWFNQLEKDEGDYSYQAGIKFVEIDPDRKNDLLIFLKNLAKKGKSETIQPQED